MNGELEDVLLDSDACHRDIAEGPFLSVAN